MKKILTMVFIVAMLTLSLVSAAIDEDMVTTQQKGIKEKVEEAKGEVVKTQERVQEKIDEVQERVQLAKKNYQEAKNQYYQNKAQYLELRSAWNNCRVENEDEECQEIRKNLKLGVRMHALNFNNMMDSSLNRIQERIENGNYSNKEENLAEIEQYRLKLEEKKAELEELSESATTEEYKAKIDEIKELWKEIQIRETNRIENMINEKAKNVANELEEKTLKAMEQKSKNNKELEKKMEQFKKEINKLKQTNDKDEIKETIGNAKGLLREFMNEYNKGDNNAETSD
jgi:hypothetical protein